MILDFCVACGEREPSKLENHHLVPRSAGGSDDATNLITLCFDCHGKAHGYQRRDIRKLVRSGMATAKAKGKKLGNPGLANRDPEAIRKATEARTAVFIRRVKASAGMWLPIVQRMRPHHKWIDVAVAVTEVAGEPWTETRLRRAARVFVSEGLADPILFELAPRSAKPTPSFERDFEQSVPK